MYIDCTFTFYSQNKRFFFAFFKVLAVLDKWESSLPNPWVIMWLLSQLATRKKPLPNKLVLIITSSLKMKNQWYFDFTSFFSICILISRIFFRLPMPKLWIWSLTLFQWVMISILTWLCWKRKVPSTSLVHFRIRRFR